MPNVEKEPDLGADGDQELLIVEPSVLVPDKVGAAIPAAAYLASLNTDVSRRSMVTVLNNAAKVVSGKRDWKLVDWRGLNAAIVDAIMAKVGGAPATRQKTLSSLSKVLLEPPLD